MKLASLEVNSSYFLAPMAGYTDKPFRKLCREFGCGLTFSELISVNALYYKNQKTYKLIERDDMDKPYCIQLFGSDPDIFLYAAQTVEPFCECIDINAGCPAPKVVKIKAGAYLLKEPKRLFKIVELLKKHISKPVSVKLRMGYSEPNKIDFYRELESLGVDFVTVHARLKSQQFKGEPNLEHVAMVRESLKIPVVYNGGIDSFAKVREIREKTGCRFFMVGQAAIGRPFIFEDLNEGVDRRRDIGFVKQVMLRHLKYMEEFWGETAVQKFRKFFHAYLRGYPNVKKFYNMINRCKTVEEAIGIIKKV